MYMYIHVSAKTISCYMHTQRRLVFNKRVCLFPAYKTSKNVTVCEKTRVSRSNDCKNYLLEEEGIVGINFDNRIRRLPAQHFR